jgi:hypothetical protein
MVNGPLDEVGGRRTRPGGAGIEGREAFTFEDEAVGGSVAAESSSFGAVLQDGGVGRLGNEKRRSVRPSDEVGESVVLPAGVRMVAKQRGRHL